MPVTSANRIPYLQTKKADLVISTLGKNPEREKVIDFTDRLLAVLPGGLRRRRRIAVKTPADLAGKTVGVTRGAMEDQELTKIAPASVDVKRFEDNNAHDLGLRRRPGAADRHRRVGGRQHDGARTRS